jgi:hypothetical protein
MFRGVGFVVVCVLVILFVYVVVVVGMWMCVCMWMLLWWAVVAVVLADCVLYDTGT